MCGIVGYIGRKPATAILLEGLKRLEYRGYDSAGIALIGSDGLTVAKAPGRISELAAKIGDRPDAATMGIAHTRWATHGAPTEVNAHPHIDGSGRIAIVHNGIIENYAALKTYLTEQSLSFESDTDTEVLAKLIGHFCRRPSGHDRSGQKGLAPDHRDRRGRVHRCLGRLGHHRAHQPGDLHVGRRVGGRRSGWVSHDHAGRLAGDQGDPAGGMEPRADRTRRV